MLTPDNTSPKDGLCRAILRSGLKEIQGGCRPNPTIPKGKIEEYLGKVWSEVPRKGTWDEIFARYKSSGANAFFCNYSPSLDDIEYHLVRVEE